MTISLQIIELKKRVKHAVQAFSTGEALLIGDDGKRENEVDFVFHASFATKEIVNSAITHAKGLLCVALDHSIADKLGFYTAPRFPGGISHTNFTLTVDAKHNITSGISAKDRAHTIQLMASIESTQSDFITPGHVFPLRSVEGGLLSRAGHTEALYELCLLSNLPCAAAMCEILGENGEPIPPNRISDNHAFAKLAFISTVDLLWYKILFTAAQQDNFKLMSENKYILHSGEEKFIRTPCAVQFYQQKFNPQTLRIVLNDGFSVKDNAVKQQNCFAEIVLFDFEGLLHELPEDISLFCDLSAKIGLRNTENSVKRFITLFRALQFIADKTEIKLTEEIINNIKFPVESDAEVMKVLV